LWLNDVGQGSLEEVDRVTLGGNYGWRCFEGTNSFNATCGPNSASSIAPVAQYGRSLGFLDHRRRRLSRQRHPQSPRPICVRRFRQRQPVAHRARDTAPTLTLTAGSALATGLQIASFGQDADGEIYIVDLGGTLHRVVPGTGAGREIPAQLSQTGCVSAANATQPASGLIPYAPNAAFFSDGATKNRWLALPDAQRIAVGADNDFDFPNGSVLVKNSAWARGSSRRDSSCVTTTAPGPAIPTNGMRAARTPRA
jgi:hypothetical protein